MQAVGLRTQTRWFARLLVPIGMLLAGSLACTDSQAPVSHYEDEADAGDGGDSGEVRELPEMPSASTVVMFDPYRSTHLFDAPFPNDDKLVNGRVDFSGYPDVDPPSSMLKSYIELANQVLDGFGCNSPVYFRMTGPLDIASLPRDELESVSKNASVLGQSASPKPNAWNSGAGRLSVVYSGNPSR